MVHRQDASQISAAMQSLLHIGIDEIDIFAEASVRIPKRWDHAVHQDPRWVSPYLLWKNALELAGSAYADRTDLFLVVRPGCYLWEQLPVYCENTVDRNLVAVWSPLTPSRIFPSSSNSRPTCSRRNDSQPRMHWCPMYVNPDVSVHHCFVLTGHMLALMAAYLPETKPPGVSDDMRIDGLNIGSALSYTLSRRRVPYYFSSPSLVQVDDCEYSADDFIGVSTYLPQRAIRTFDFIREFANK